MDDLFIETPAETANEAAIRAKEEANSAGITLKPSHELIIGFVVHQIEVVFGVEKAILEFSADTKECTVTAHQVWYVDEWEHIVWFIAAMERVSSFSIVPKDGYFDAKVTIPDVIV